MRSPKHLDLALLSLGLLLTAGSAVAGAGFLGQDPAPLIQCSGSASKIPNGGWIISSCSGACLTIPLTPCTITERMDNGVEREFCGCVINGTPFEPNCCHVVLVDGQPQAGGDCASGGCPSGECKLYDAAPEVKKAKCDPT